MANSEQKRNFFWLWHLAIAVGGACLVYAVSGDFRSHVLDLQAHLRSGNWEVTTNRKSVESRLHSTYQSEPRKWTFHFVGGSIYALSMTDIAREETLQTLGNWSLKDSPGLSNNLAPLWVTYRAFLTSALLEVAQNASRKDSTAVKRLVANIRHEGTPESTTTEHQYEAAQRILAKLPRTDTLRNALESYRLYERESLGQPAFSVATEPEYDVENAWDSAAVLLEQESKCRAKVTPTGGTDNAISATMTVYPRVVEVQLKRPWLSDELLDNYERRTSSTTSAFFGGSDRRLGVIPSRLWVLMAEEVQFDVASTDDRHAMERWAKESRCCTATCDELSMSLNPLNAFRIKDGTYRLRRAAAVPLLFAIVSRKREEY